MPHTPGPWKIYERNEEAQQIGYDYGTFEIVSPWSDTNKPGEQETYGDYRGALICKIEHQGSKAPIVTRRHAEANARLIAASPEMEALLREQVEAMNAMPMNDINFAGRDWMVRTIALLAKIEGTSHV